MEAFPSSSLNFSTFFLMFYVLYVFAYFVVFRNWPKHRAEASSCIISLAHGTPAVLLSSYAAITSTQSTFASSNTIFQDIVLEFSMAYFLMDLIHYIIFISRDILFILHHLATLYVFVTCRYVVHQGAFGLLILLILAEITSPCQNVWSLSSFRKADVPAYARLHQLLSAPFYTFYSVVRGILGPLFVYKLWLIYISGAADNLIPVWARLSWMVVITSAILLSMLWVLSNWVGWYRKRKLGYSAGKKMS